MSTFYIKTIDGEIFQTVVNKGQGMDLIKKFEKREMLNIRGKKELLDIMGKKELYIINPDHIITIKVVHKEDTDNE